MSDDWVKTLFAMPTENMPLPLLEESLRLAVQAKDRFEKAINNYHNYHRRVLIENPIKATAWFNAEAQMQGRELVGFQFTYLDKDHYQEDHFRLNLSLCLWVPSLWYGAKASALMGLHYRDLHTGRIESYFYQSTSKYIIPYHRKDNCPNKNLCNSLAYEAEKFFKFAEKLDLRVSLSHFTLDKDTVYTWF